MATFKTRGNAQVDRETQNAQDYLVYRELCGRGWSCAMMDNHHNAKDGTAYRKIKQLNEVYRQGRLKVMTQAQFPAVFRSDTDISEDADFYTDESASAQQWLEEHPEEFDAAVAVVRELQEQYNELTTEFNENRDNPEFLESPRYEEIAGEITELNEQIGAAKNHIAIRHYQTAQLDTQWREFIAGFQAKYPLLKPAKSKRGRTAARMPKAEDLFAEIGVSFDNTLDEIFA